MPTEFRDGGSGQPELTDGSGAVDPSSVTVDAPEPAVKRGRGRPRKDGTAPQSRTGGQAQAARVALDLSGLTGMFVGLHALLSEATRVPELAVSQDEGQAFMTAAKNVMRHYSVSATQKTIDWIAFTGTVGGIYGTRFASYTMRRRDEKAVKTPVLPGAIVVAEVKPAAVKTNGTKPPPNMTPRNIPPITPDAHVDPFGGGEE